MKKQLLLLLASSFLIGGCNTPEEPDDPKGPEIIDTEDDFIRGHALPGLLVEDSTTMRVHYLSSDFTANNEEFNANLAINSLATSIASQKVNIAKQYFETMKFDDIYSSESYETSKNDELIAYTFAHKMVNDNHLVAVAIRGIAYDKTEWVDDFNIGLEGDHTGFYHAAMTVCSDLQNYIEEYTDDNALIKYWITGYSRAGAVASFLAEDMHEQPNTYHTDSHEIYAYTFEAPKYSSLRDQEMNYIHSVVNHADLITYVAPEQFGFYRYGLEFDITNENAVELVKEEYPLAEFDAFAEQTLDFSTFAPKPVEGGITDPKVYYPKMIEKILSVLKSSDETIDLTKREQYVEFFNKVQIVLDELLSAQNIAKFKNYEEVFAAQEPPVTKDTIMSDFFSYLSTFNDDPEGLYKFVVKYLDMLEVTYPEDTLKEMCATLQPIVMNIVTKIMAEVLGGGVPEGEVGLLSTIGTIMGNTKYIYAMHCPETTYVLLKEAIAK